MIGYIFYQEYMSRQHIVPEYPDFIAADSVKIAMKYHGITECYLKADGNYYFDRNGNRINLFGHKKKLDNKLKNNKNGN